MLLDVQLPDIDGFRVSEALTAMAGAPAVVLVSSRSRDDYGDQVTGSGARGFVAKAEVSGNTLRAVLAQVTANRP
ncbi:response regulator [Modestobacter altitudinis]|uniref:response regulator n=1 Tax=Modestobacter altitudinis TaxID=2213158 RepID=UPI00110CCB1F|nr:response regulator [Modestobacter altitudinis]